MVPDKPQKVENFHFTWCGYIGFRARCYVKGEETCLIQSNVLFTNAPKMTIYIKNTFADRKDVFLENVRIHNKVVIVGFKIVNF